MDPKCGSYEFILIRSLSYPESSFVFVQNPSQDKVTIEVTSALVETIGSSTYTVWLRARNETEPNLFVDNVIVINVICEVQTANLKTDIYDFSYTLGAFAYFQSAEIEWHPNCGT